MLPQAASARVATDATTVRLMARMASAAAGVRSECKTAPTAMLFLRFLGLVMMVFKA